MELRRLVQIVLYICMSGLKKVLGAVVCGLKPAAGTRWRNDARNGIIMNTPGGIADARHDGELPASQKFRMRCEIRHRQYFHVFAAADISTGA